MKARVDVVQASLVSPEDKEPDLRLALLRAGAGLDALQSSLSTQIKLRLGHRAWVTEFKCHQSLLQKNKRKMGITE